MAQLGRLRIKVQDTLGNAISGASVEVRRQGAQTVGTQAGSPQTVDAVNGIVVGDEVATNTASSPTRTVTAITATTVSCGLGFNTTDDDRLSIVSPLPTIYVDAQGNETASNPMTTNSVGTAECYVYGGLYDILVSGGGATTTLYQDVGTEGFAGSIRSNVYSGESFHLDHLRALAVTDEAFIISENSDGNDLFKVMGDGEIQAGIAGATHALTGNTTITGTLTSSGALTVQAGGAAVTGAVSATTALSAGTTVTAGTGLTVSAGGAAVTGAVTATTSVDATTTVTAGTGITATTGNIQATAGDFDGRRLKMNNGTALVDGDAAISAGWGNTATRTMGTGSTDTRGSLIVTCGGAGIAADPTVTITFKDGTYGANAYAIVSRGATNQVPEVAYDWSVETVSATAMQVRFIGTPTNTFVYTLKWAVIG